MGLLDAYIRIFLGLIMLAGCSGQKKHPIMTVLGSMKVAEGVTRFCPCLYLMNKNTKHFPA